MGKIKGYSCSKCQYEKEYLLGIGFKNETPNNLFECEGCGSLKLTRKNYSTCSKCNKKRFNISYIEKILTCPKCKSYTFENTVIGNWD